MTRIWPKKAPIAKTKSAAAKPLPVIDSIKTHQGTILQSKFGDLMQ